MPVTSTIHPYPRWSRGYSFDLGLETSPYLGARGAAVEYFECYRRVKPARNTSELVSWLDRDAIKACLATSSNIVENLFEMAGIAGRSRLCAVPFFVPHPRVAATAFSQGVQCVFVAGSGDEALVTGMQTWFARSQTFR